MACQVKGAAVITGAGSGIGKATAISFAQNGIQSITLVDLNLSHLERSRDELRAQFSTVSVEIIQANVADEASVDDAVRKTVERFGSIDIGINCAGIIGTPTPTDQMTLAEWQKVIDVNQTGVWLCQRALIRQMLKQEWVAHLARDLEASTLTFNLNRAAYVKGEALSSMSRRCSACVVLQGRSKFPMTLHPSMDAKAYSRRGIRINAICPGFVDTPIIKEQIESGSMNPVFEMTPLGRPARVEEISDAILFLSSPMSSYMCGAALVVDGGFTV